MEDMGNSRARAIYEANLTDNYKRPANSNSAMEQFIRAKYEHKKYIAKEWIPSKPRSAPVRLFSPTTCWPPKLSMYSIEMYPTVLFPRLESSSRIPGEFLKNFQDFLF